MQKLFYLKANLLAGFPDMEAGAFVAVVIAMLGGQTHLGLAAIVPCLWGAFWFVSPDMDIVPFILRRGFTGKPFSFDHHQTFLHWPLVMLPIVGAATWFLLGGYWSAVAVVCMLGHYIHDAVYMEDGFKWLLRLKRKYASIPRQKNGPKTADEWIEKNWMQPSQLSLVELSVGNTLASVALLLATHDSILAITYFFGVDIAVWIFWRVARTLKYA